MMPFTHHATIVMPIDVLFREGGTGTMLVKLTRSELLLFFRLVRELCPSSNYAYGYATDLTCIIYTPAYTPISYNILRFECVCESIYELNFILCHFYYNFFFFFSLILRLYAIF